MKKQVITIVFVLLVSIFVGGCSQATMQENHEHANGNCRLHSNSGARLVDQVGIYYTDAVSLSEIYNSYKQWKNDYLKDSKVSGDYYVKMIGTGSGYSDSNPITSSEAMAYGMLMTVMLDEYENNAQKIFDGLYRFTRRFPSLGNSRLMAWRILEGEVAVSSAYSATDGDIDIAYALILADKTWGSNGTINYKADAKAIIAALESSCISSDYRVKLGDWHSNSGKFDGTESRSSDWMTGQFEVFKRYGNATTWQRVIDKCYDLIDSLNTNYGTHYKYDFTTGFLPDFIRGTTPTPTANVLEGDNDEFYAKNAIRVPMRLAVHAAHFDNPRAVEHLARMSHFFNSCGGPEVDLHAYYVGKSLSPYYRLDGRPLHPEWNASMKFLAPAMCALITEDSCGYTEWVDGFVKKIKNKTSMQLDEWETDPYYGDSLKILSLLLVSGNWPNPLEMQSPHTTSWEANTYYPEGAVVLYNGKNWKNTYAHTSYGHWYPGAPGIWFWEEL